jgi:thiamine transport system permease protein
MTGPYGRRAPLLAAVAPAAVLALFYVWPVATVMVRALDGSAVLEVWRNEGIRSVVWFTVWQAIASTVITVLVGLAPAHLLSHYRFPGRRMVVAVVTVPFVLPTVVVGAAFLAVLPDSLERSIWSILLAHVFFNIAIVVRTVGGVWGTIDPDLAAAARCLGASPLRAFREVTLPLLRPAIMSAAMLVFVFTATSYGVVRILGGPGRATVEVEIFLRATQLGDLSGAAVLALGQLLAIGIVLVWWGRGGAWGIGTHAAEPIRRARTRRERVTLATVLIPLVAFVTVPIAAMVLRSVRVAGRWTLRAWTSLGTGEIRPGLRSGADPIDAALTSLRVATTATVVAVVLGAAAAAAIAYAGRGARTLDTLSMLPLATSAVTIGFGILITFDEDPFDLRGSAAIVPLVHALVAMPFVVRAVVPVLAGIPPDRRLAAATLGASPRRVWWNIDRPAALPALATGAAFSFAVSMGEFGATSFLTRRGSETLPIAIARLLGRTGDLVQAQAYALSTILFVSTLVVLLAVDGLGRPAMVAR